MKCELNVRADEDMLQNLVREFLESQGMRNVVLSVERTNISTISIGCKSGQREFDLTFQGSEDLDGGIKFDLLEVLNDERSGTVRMVMFVIHPDVFDLFNGEFPRFIVRKLFPEMV